MSSDFKFPQPPPGHYFQIRNGLESDYPAAPWRVVLVRKRWFFPKEAAGAELEHLTPEAVRAAAEQAIDNFTEERLEKLLNKARKQLNREARKK